MRMNAINKPANMDRFTFEMMRHAMLNAFRKLPAVLCADFTSSGWDELATSSILLISGPDGAGISIVFINVFICSAKPEAGVFLPPINGIRASYRPPPPNLTSSLNIWKIMPV